MNYKSRKICKNKEYIYHLMANTVYCYFFIKDIKIFKYEIALDITFNAHLLNIYNHVHYLYVKLYLNIFVSGFSFVCPEVGARCVAYISPLHRFCAAQR